MFKDIELKDKAVFNQYLMGGDNKTDLANFTSLFLWKDWGGHTTWDIICDTIVVQKTYQGEAFTFCPISPDKVKVDEAVRTLIKEAKKAGTPLKFTEINEDQKAIFLKYCPDCFTIAENRDASDYIYNVIDLIELPGRAYSSKRNHINKFMRTHTDYELKLMTVELLPLCEKYINVWAENHYNNDDPHFQGEYQGTLLALKHFTELDITGLCLFVDGKMEGFTIGEPLNKNTVVIHIEKATADMDGAYPLLNREFLNLCWRDYEFVNREEDMGMEGLRKAKESYHPCKLEMTYTLELNH